MTNSEVCEHSTTVGSYPGERSVWCDLPVGHRGEHTASVSWACEYPECDQAKPEVME